MRSKVIVKLSEKDEKVTGREILDSHSPPLYLWVARSDRKVGFIFIHHVKIKSPIASREAYSSDAAAAGYFDPSIIEEVSGR